ncbi:endo-beta-1,6-galactanase [Auriculariales sp. MPI-PUGE-AT-0066]|nr:endo-beta-1,6-galactanase [Auriculariales sp. MPI-PUGE-AT-0066]
MHLRTFVALAVALSGAEHVFADTTTTIVASSNRGTWEGWGVSLAWWAKKFGNNDALANLLFTTTTGQSWNGQSLPGLGLNIVRYNAGACSWNTYNGTSMVASANIKSSRQMETYWINWASTDPTSSSFSWSVDANQRAMLQKAKSRGANIAELFLNAPPWWMSANKNPSGASDGSENLQSWNQQDVARYLAIVALYAKNNWGITFTSVDPFNEPSATWWKADGTQEGCHVNVATQATVINYLRSELDSRGLSSTIVSASDESYYDQAVTAFNGLGATARGNVGRYNVHGYQYGSGSRDGLASLVSGAGKKVWQSEYGESDATGVRMLSNFLLDMIWLKPTAWVYWQALDVGGWGLITADNDAGTLGAASQKYFAFAQLSRHIKPGMRLLDGGADNTIAALDTTNKKLVIVAVNWGSAQYLNFELSQFGTKPANNTLVQRWKTVLGSGDQYKQYSDTYTSGTKFWSYFETNVLQTFEITGVAV